MRRRRLAILAAITGITFVVLKLTGVIDWNWFIVAAPFAITAIRILRVFLGGRR